MLLYAAVRAYIKMAIFLFYKRVIISGKENIPKEGPILFVANHQNAMMDPLIVATATDKTMYFMARASAFKNKIAAKLLNAIHAIAIYRVRDGVNSKALNEAVFDECLSLFNQKKNILIFPEGNHNIKKQVRSLRAGFARMTMDYLLANPDEDLSIVSVGLNFDDTVHYAKSLHIIFGKPISARQFFDENDLNKSKGNLIKEVHHQLTKVTVHIENDNYEEQFKTLTEEDFLHPVETNKKLQTPNPKPQTPNSKLQTPNPKPQTPNSKPQTPNSKPKNIFYYLMGLNSIFPFLIWKWLELRIKEKEFISTAKFSLGITIFPLFYFLQTLLLYHFFGDFYALSYIVLCFVLVILSTKTR